jgi:hypothetical protein
MGHKGNILHEYLTAEITLTNGAPSADVDFSAMGIPSGDGLAVNTGECPDSVNPIVTASSQTAGFCSQLVVVIKSDVAGPPVVYNRDKKATITAVPTPNGAETIKCKCLVKYMYSPLGEHVNMDGL